MNKSDLRRIIKEEITKVLNEESYDTLRDLKAAGVNPYNKDEVEKYLGRELSDSEYKGMLGRKQKTIVGRRNGRPIYSDGTVGESKTRDLYESNLKDIVENKEYEGEEILTILGDMPDTVKDAYQNTIKLNVPSFSMISDTQSLRSKEDVKNYIRIFQTKFDTTPIFINVTKKDNIFNAKTKLNQGDGNERKELKKRHFGLN